MPGARLSICHFAITSISRGAGRSIVAAAAYRSGARLHDQRLGQSFDYRGKSGVAHTEIVLPEGVDAPDWMRRREDLWNAMEAARPRKNALLGTEFVLALPHELDAPARLALAQDYAQRLSNRLGVAADLAIHAPNPDGDERNHHAHILVSALKVTPDGWGDRYDFAVNRSNREARGMLPVHTQVRDLRREWADCVNEHLARAGLEARIDPRSFRERGIDLQPTQHKGPAAVAAERGAGEIIRAAGLTEQQEALNARTIRERPDQLLELLTTHEAVFSRQEIAIAVHRYVGTHADYGPALAAVMNSPELIQLQGDLRRHKDGHVVEVVGARQFDTEGREILDPARFVSDRDRLVEPARFTTRAVRDLERGMANTARQLAGRTQRLPTPAAAIASRVAGDPLLAAREAAYRAMTTARGGSFDLTAEQKRAVEHVTQDDRLSLVLGVAGAGKSTMLEAARRTWHGAGYEVIGSALAAKAASGLWDSSGIESRTIESLVYGWQRRDEWGALSPLQREEVLVRLDHMSPSQRASYRGPAPPPSTLKTLHAGSVLVVDEAGMVDSRTMAKLVTEVDRTGAKLVLVGDPNQLPAIGAGAAFRSIAERVGYAEIATVYRQREQWQRDATTALSKGRVGDALQAYDSAGGIRFEVDLHAARDALVTDYLADAARAPAETRAALAFRNVDVDALNGAIRAGRRAGGHLGPDVLFPATRGRGQAGGQRELPFAVGDRIHFLANGALQIESASGGRGRRAPTHKVDNSDLGTIVMAQDGRLVVQLDGLRNGAARPLVVVDHSTYRSIDHGYAVTIHKAQGATVDRAYVLPIGLDRALSYVALSRHRDELTVYATRDTTKDLGALTDSMSVWRFKQSSLDYARDVASPGRDVWRQWTEQMTAGRLRQLKADDLAREAAAGWAATKASMKRMGPAGLAALAHSLTPAPVKPSDIEASRDVSAARDLVEQRSAALEDVTRDYALAIKEARSASPFQQREARAQVAHLQSAKTSAELELGKAERRLESARASSRRFLEQQYATAQRRHDYTVKVLDGMIAREDRDQARADRKKDRELTRLPANQLAEAVRRLEPALVSTERIEADPELGSIARRGWELNAQYKATKDPAQRQEIGKRLDALDANYKSLSAAVEKRLQADYMSQQARYDKGIRALDRTLRREARVASEKSTRVRLSTAERDAQHAQLVAQRNVMIGTDFAKTRPVLSSERHTEALAAVRCFFNTQEKYRATFQADSTSTLRSSSGGVLDERRRLLSSLRQQADAILSDPARSSMAREQALAGDVARLSSAGDASRRRVVEERRNALLLAERAKSNMTATSVPMTKDAAAVPAPRLELSFGDRLERGIREHDRTLPKHVRAANDAIAKSTSAAANKSAAAVDKSRDLGHGRER